MPVLKHISVLVLAVTLAILTVSCANKTFETGSSELAADVQVIEEATTDKIPTDPPQPQVNATAASITREETLPPPSPTLAEPNRRITSEPVTPHHASETTSTGQLETPAPVPVPAPAPAAASVPAPPAAPPEKIEETSTVAKEEKETHPLSLRHLFLTSILGLGTVGFVSMAVWHRNAKQKELSDLMSKFYDKS